MVASLASFQVCLSVLLRQVPEVNDHENMLREFVSDLLLCTVLTSQDISRLQSKPVTSVNSILCTF